MRLLTITRQDHVYHPFRHELHRRPSARLWQLNEIFDRITLIAADLYNVACESRQWALKADRKCKEFKYRMRIVHEALAKEIELEQKTREEEASSSSECSTPSEITTDHATHKKEHAAGSQRHAATEEMVPPSMKSDIESFRVPGLSSVSEDIHIEHSAAVEKDVCSDQTAVIPPNSHIADAESAPEDKIRKFGRSFSTVEEAVHHRGHARAVTEKAPNYSTRAQELGSGASGQPRFGSVIRRNGHNVPRIFTGSFSELEDSVRKLRLPAIELPPIPPTTLPRPAGVHSAAVTNAHTSPLASVPSSPTIPPSPSTLQRREALIERDVAFQDRIINGGVIRSRRPSDRLLSEPTVNGPASAQQVDVLDRWLNEETEPVPSHSGTRGKKHTL
jgi:hypothetical protein